MSSADPNEKRFRMVAGDARRILEALGRAETSDSSRIVYTEGDLNIARESGLFEIIFRGSLVFRYAPEGDARESVFEEHGVWPQEVERIAASISKK